MQYRKQDASGDYVFGHGPQQMLSGVDAVQQATRTRLELWYQTFWRDLSDGIPMMQQILAGRGSDAHLAQVTSLIRRRIEGTTGVIAVYDIAVDYDRELRKYTYQSTTQTVYSKSLVSSQGTV